ncbi:nuclear transport factor 2 family protein [Flavobacterium humi]|uniref:Nuclear transport factor 2 family protein n=1 Tax=Flavobacterium humi TaxID=2562683 RepID=A0A4Z0LCN3_9FLAO|nr:nuclear transport factor 2 family protein [Flavobacterium humi]TGD59625.1 nuclear transport factor 2 family protein [Flavobacterium humi]
MKAKEIVKNFYKSDAFRDSALLDTFIHPDVTLDWNSSKGFLQLNREEMLKLASEMQKAYDSSRIYITHIIEEEDTVSVRYIHYVKTIENPREEMILAHFMVIWELKAGKLYRGFQMSQLS